MCGKNCTVECYRVEAQSLESCEGPSIAIKTTSCFLLSSSFPLRSSKTSPTSDHPRQFLHFGGVWRGRLSMASSIVRFAGWGRASLGSLRGQPYQISRFPRFHWRIRSRFSRGKYENALAFGNAHWWSAEGRHWSCEAQTSLQACTPWILFELPSKYFKLQIESGCCPKT